MPGKKITLVVICLLLLTGCGNVGQSSKLEITISAASSLSDALTELSDDFEKTHGVKVHLNLASSGTLERQIEEGAPVDVFISASKQYMSQLEKRKLINRDEQTMLLTNQLVLIVPSANKNKIKTLNNLTNKGIERIAIGIPKTVPAGMYAKETLISLGIWEQVQEKLIFAKDVKQVLSYVETGNVDAGLVYQTDSRLSDQVAVVAKAKDSLHTPITYPAAVLRDAPHPKVASDFFAFIQSKHAKQTFIKYGFIPK